MSDTLQPINCPACHKEMRKLYIPSQGINIDICLDGCGGIFFNNREFKYFDEKAEGIDDILEVIQGKEFEKVDTSLPRTCPVCGSKMVKNFSSVKEEVEVEDCYSCGGKFLDNGELQKIREEYDTDEARSEATMKKLYDTVGVKLKAIEAESELAKSKQSPIKKLFDAMIYGKSNI